MTQEVELSDGDVEPDGSNRSTDGSKGDVGWRSQWAYVAIRRRTPTVKVEAFLGEHSGIEQ